MGPTRRLSKRIQIRQHYGDLRSFRYHIADLLSFGKSAINLHDGLSWNRRHLPSCYRVHSSRQLVPVMGTCCPRNTYRQIAHIRYAKIQHVGENHIVYIRRYSLTSLFVWLCEIYARLRRGKKIVLSSQLMLNSPFSDFF